MENKEIEKYKLELGALDSEPYSGYKKICCTSCNSEIPADNININDKIAKCNNCNVVFSFQEGISDLLNQRKIKQEVIRPEGIDIFYFQDDLDITIQQPLTPLEAVGIFLLPFFAFIFTLLFFKGKITFLFPGIFWMLTLYPVINMLFRSRHKINLSIDDNFLSIKWRPKKFHKDKYYPVQDINQIYTKTENGQSSIYMILNGANGQKHVKLIALIDSLSKARYLEQEIEWHLGIEDREVPEEKA